MQAVREIQTAESSKISVDIPSVFLHRKVEIIVIPLEEVSAPTWPVGFFELTAGSFADQPLVREDQGTYELRNAIQ
jgi:hypothetical protein